jgi:hypothetical protein
MLLAFACVAGSSASFGSDTYNAVTHQLTIPELQFGNVTFWDAVVTPGKLVGIAGGAPKGFWDAYIVLPGAGDELTAPSVVDGATTYTNVTAIITNMTSVGSVSGADSYDGTYLYIPSVLAGNKLYSYVVLTVSGVDSLQSGLPERSIDTYDLTTRELEIPAVQVGGRAFTNAAVSVGKVVSVNGSGTVAGGANSSTCYNPTYYETGTTMELKYEDPTAGSISAYEAQSVVVAPSTFAGVSDAVGIQITTTTSQSTTTATEYYDTSSKPLILQLGSSSSFAGDQIFTPGLPFGGALGYGQSLQASGVLTYTGGSSNYTSDSVFEGLEDVTVPAGTFQGACKWSVTGNFGFGNSKTTTWTSHKGVLLQDGTSQLQAGSTFNGGPVGP